MGLGVDSSTMTEVTCEEHSQSIWVREGFKDIEIAERIHGVVAPISSCGNKGSGFFANIYNQNVFLTALHIIKDKSDIRIADADKGEMFNLISEIAMLSVKTKSPDFQLIKTIPLVPDDYEIQVGAPVYFTGYPLTYNNPIFHKGMISSVERDSLHPSLPNKFTIDGTILPGHSGAPVCVFFRSCVFLLGIIVSESVSSKRAIEQLCEHEDKEVREIGHVFKTNISTGVGVARDLRVCKKLLAGELEDILIPLPELLEKEDDELETKKGIGVCREIVFEDVEGNQISDELNVYEITKDGSGNRPIQVIFQGQKCLYKLDFNPHHSKKYNKNQRPFYNTFFNSLAEKIKNEQGTFPSTFTFEFGKQTYTATQQ